MGHVAVLSLDQFSVTEAEVIEEKKWRERTFRFPLSTFFATTRLFCTKNVAAFKRYFDRNPLYGSRFYKIETAKYFKSESNVCSIVNT